MPVSLCKNVKKYAWKWVFFNITWKVFAMSNGLKVEIDINDYIVLLNDRRNFVAEHYNWKIPDCLWDYFCSLIEECGIYGNTNPSYVVDNAIINGDYGDFDDYKQTGETDEDFISRVADEVFYINKRERIVCFRIWKT